MCEARSAEYIQIYKSLSARLNLNGVASFEQSL